MSQRQNERDGAEVGPTEFAMVKERLQKCLDAAETPAFFVWGDTMKDAPNPGLYLKELGFVPFPLGPQQLQLIKQASGLGIENKGREALFYTSAFTTHQEFWEVPSSSWLTKNPSWNKTLDGLRDNICAKSGISPDLQLFPSCLILQEEGSSLTSFPSPDPTASSFGHIDIVLPSKHSGGDVMFQYCNKEYEVSTSVASEYDCFFYSRFYDIKAKSTALTSGHRLLLRYTFGYASQDHTFPSVADLIANIAEIKLVLKSWQRLYTRSPHGVHAYLLENRYEQCFLSSQALKNRDIPVLSQLQEGCRSTEFYICFGMVEKTISGIHDDPFRMESYHDMDLIESRLSLKWLTELDGTEICKNRQFEYLEEDDILHLERLESWEPVEVNHDGKDGSSTYVYQQQAAIILPLNYRTSFLGKFTSE